jgi:hypothetical protein
VIFVNRGLLNRRLVPAYAVLIIATLMVLLPFHVPLLCTPAPVGFFNLPARMHRVVRRSSIELPQPSALA